MLELVDSLNSIRFLLTLFSQFNTLLVSSKLGNGFSSWNSLSGESGMRAVVTYVGRVHIEKEDGGIEELSMRDQSVEVIGAEGDSIYVCKTIGFPWVGKFRIRRENVRIIEEE